MKRIVLIGPVYPYKGGISHYTGLMYNELAKHYNVEMISYKMQYPKILFKKEQKDYENDSFKIEDAKYLINTANPLNIIKTARYIKKMKPDMVIIQWWHPYFAPCYKLLEWFMGKQTITFVCHNVFPHERFPMDHFLTKSVLKKADYYILHAEEEKKELLSIKPQARAKVSPHPTYNAFRFCGMNKEEARQILSKKHNGLDKSDKILLFFGFVRAYKGLKYLIGALPEVRDKLGNVKLMVVGEFGTDKNEYIELINRLSLTDMIVIIDGYTPDREVEPYFSAADVIVLPYISATQSGIVQIAYGFEKPVIVTDVGGLPDVVDDGVTGYVVEHENEKKLAEAIIKFYQEDKENAFVEQVKAQAYRFSWERMGEVVESFFEENY